MPQILSDSGLGSTDAWLRRVWSTTQRVIGARTAVGRVS
jgi:hypothetical protein